MYILYISLIKRVDIHHSTPSLSHLYIPTQEQTREKVYFPLLSTFLSTFHTPVQNNPLLIIFSEIKDIDNFKYLAISILVLYKWLFLHWGVKLVPL